MCIRDRYGGLPRTLADGRTVNDGVIPEGVFMPGTEIYMLVNPEDMELEDGKTYQVAISGISEKLASETEVTDSGVVGMDAAKEFFGQFETLSEADAEWK